MKPLDLLEHFDKGAGAFGFIATYEFDPQFFERRILAKRTFGYADRLVVFLAQRQLLLAPQREFGRRQGVFSTDCIAYVHVQTLWTDEAIFPAVAGS